MIDVILGLGSNKSWNGMDSLFLLRKACLALREFLTDFSCSSVYRTKPLYLLDQPDFYNMVVRGKVGDSCSPFELLDEIQKIEKKLGRNREVEVRNGCRSMDIDIEFFGSQRIDTEKLTIPHPRIKERAFVLVPLLEILNEDADFIKKEDFSECLKNTGFAGVEKYGHL